MFKLLGEFKPIFRKFALFSPRLVGRALFCVEYPIHNLSTEYCIEHKEQMIAHYNQHNSRIQEMVPADRLLVLTKHNGGWEPICSFLGIPIPDKPFPHANRRESMLLSVLQSAVLKPLIKYIWIIMAVFFLYVLWSNHRQEAKVHNIKED